MTAKTFRRYVWVSALFLLLLSVVTLWVGVIYDSHKEDFRAIIPVYIAIEAAWLAFCLQRRISYTNALRAFWEKITETVQEAIYLTKNPNSSPEDRRRLLYNLSRRIDEVRGIFKNVNEKFDYQNEGSDKIYVYDVKKSSELRDISIINSRYPGIDRKYIGLYPFESLKQMHKVVVLWDQCESAGEAELLTVRKALENLWHILRAELLKELDRDYPQFPEGPFA